MKVLQITYHYPPMGGAGVQRGLKFSKYLPQFGVQTVVLAGADPHYVQDASLMAEVPAGLEVHRVAHSPLLARLAARRRAAVDAAAPSSHAAAAAAASGPAAAASVPPGDAAAGWATRGPAAAVAPESAGARGALREGLLRAVRALQMPDDAAAWARRALPRARAIVLAHAARGEPFDLVFSSSPPASAHALAERIASEFGLPWVADFRDLWTDNPAYDAPAWRRAIDRRLEQRWLDGATGIVTVTPSWQQALRARRPAGAPVAFIPNGYDEDDFAALVPRAHDGGLFTLVHTGTFYGPRDPAGLLGGLARYLDGPRAGHPALRVRLVGNMGARFGQALHAFSVRYPGVVQGVPYLPHTQALGELMAADALLLVVGGGQGPAVQGWLPGKIFEYLRSGKPVLTLGDPQGDAAQLVQRHGTGWVVADDDAAGIARALAQMLQGGRGETIAGDATPAPPAATPALFERRELARQLADFLRQCHSRHAGR